MRRLPALILALTAMLALAGCAGGGGVPKAATPVTTHDFGDVPVSSDPKDTRTKEFVIQNTGAADLKLSNLQVKLLEGC